MVKPVPFSVIGGFLGAGKTTLVNDLLKNATARYAVLVNDFGKLNIDEKLIREHNGETIALANGCICCSLAAGFSEGLGAIIDKIEQFDHVIVEASGVANPQRIQDIAKIQPVLEPRANVVLVDASQINQQVEDAHIGSLVLEQIHAADLLIVNKQGLLSGPQRRAVDLYLDQLSTAQRYATDYALIPANQVLGAMLSSKCITTPLISKTDNHNLFSRVISSEQQFTQQQFDLWRQQLPIDILRGKGVVYFAGSEQAWLWHKVGEQQQLSAYQGGHLPRNQNSEVVLIAKNKESLPNSFD